ncbi:MAG: hypothetical protein K2N94_04895 [Lachnospiraceae bacterium]|nr:hypothetical protein [Lachnospiraceae bacterium]
MKAILVMEMPKECIGCPMFNASDACVLQNEDANFNADAISDLETGCPLKPMPERKALSVARTMTDFGWINGFNACLDAIGGETKC